MSYRALYRKYRPLTFEEVAELLMLIFLPDREARGKQQWLDYLPKL